jgi:hypothetical protein
VREIGQDLQVESINGEREVQRQWEDGRIAKARCNERYRDIDVKGRIPEYLETRNIANTSRGNEVRAIIKLRCGNLEQVNKYWMDESQWTGLFCDKGRDSLDHYVKECEEIKEWFKDLGEISDRIIEEIYNEELGRCKGKIIQKLWKERERKLKKRKEVEARERESRMDVDSRDN